MAALHLPSLRSELHVPMTTSQPNESTPGASEAPPSILIVDDDEALRERLAKAFRSRGYEARTAASYEQAVALAESDSPEYAIVDLRLPGRSGLEIVKALKAIDSETKIVVLTGYGSIATAMEAVRLGAVNYLSKPADADGILQAFVRADDPEKPVSLDTYVAPSLARAEWEHINRVLSDCDGNVSEAARRLRIHRRSLQRKLQKYPPKD
jgi:two-component system response regulator RegA